MKELEVDILSFESKGDGQIVKAEKGPKITVSCKEIKEKIEQGIPVITIPAYDNEKEKEDIEK